MGGNKDILDAIEKVDWAALHHAYGLAVDVPDLLRGLLSPDESIRQESLYELCGTIWHQGSVYEASPHAVPILLAMLRSPEVPDKAGIALLLAELADGQASLENFADEAGELGRIFRESLRREGRDFETELAEGRLHLQATREAVGKGVALLFPYLAHAEPEVRESIARALGHYPCWAAQSVPLLEAALKGEGEDDVRGSIEVAQVRLKRDGS